LNLQSWTQALNFSGLTSDIIFNGITAKSFAEKAELLNYYFSVFTTSSTDIEDCDGEVGELTVDVAEIMSNTWTSPKRVALTRYQHIY
jgi:hypothetical protein